MNIYEFDGIGTHWAIEILNGQEFSSSLIAKVHATVDQFDRRYSRFRDDSLIAELARTGTLHNPPAEMINMLTFAKEMYDVSEGAFTVAVGATLHRMGYGSRMHGHKLYPYIWDDIIISPEKVIIPKGEMLDFGGFGKGWLIELLIQVLRQTGIREFIVNGGGDLYCQSDTPIEFKLEDLYDDKRQYGQTKITRGALAVSNTVKRSWDDGGTRKHHIIDPMTDDSSDSGVIATYVRADSALIADTMATILILRPELEHDLIERYNLRTIIVRA